MGVNAFKSDTTANIPTLKVHDEVQHSQIERLLAVKRARSAADVKDKLQAVENAARGNQNLMYPVLDAVRAYCTLGEISDVFRKVWGAYREAGSF